MPSSQASAYPFKLVSLIAILSAASLILQHGFGFIESHTTGFAYFDLGLAGVLVSGLIAALYRQKRSKDLFRERRFDFIFVFLFLTALAMTFIAAEQIKVLGRQLFHQESIEEIRGAIVQFYLLSNIGLQVVGLLQTLFLKGVRPEIILAGSFSSLVLIGTMLLLMPRAAAASGTSLSWVDAFFTATSAVCVTGLVVVDPGSQFSTLGQMIILGLFQIGGLGIITFVAFVSVFSAKTLPVPQMIAFRRIISTPNVSDLKRRLAGVVVLTILIEAAGAAILFLSLSPGTDLFSRIKWSVFHSVSAFCNAGFALQSDSLTSSQGNVLVNLTIIILVILGGLGFLVLPELLGKLNRATHLWRIKFTSNRYKFLRPALPRLSVQTKMSLWVTFILVVFGFMGFYILEGPHLLSERRAGESSLIALFHSVSARTAGFNTIDISSLQPASLILLTILMVIGACPVSTGGGIKTVTFGILILAMRSMLLQKEKVEAFGRTLPPRSLFTALSVFVLYFMTAAVGIFLLALFDPQIPGRDQAFEIISALSTVGLSTGITAELSTPGKLVLCAAMFIGRVGPISLVFSVFQSHQKMDYEFPPEEVVVG